MLRTADLFDHFSDLFIQPHPKNKKKNEFSEVKLKLKKNQPTCLNIESGVQSQLFVFFSHCL